MKKLIMPGYDDSDVPDTTGVHIVVLTLFWSAFVLNSTAVYLPNRDVGAAIAGIAAIFYLTNVVFLVLGSVPGQGALRGKTCDCACSCMSRPYAVASAVFLGFTIVNIITLATM